MKETYTQAVLKHLKDGVAIETIATGLNRVLAARGHQQLAAAIWQSVLRVTEAAKASGSTVYVISNEAYTAQKDAIVAVLTSLGTDTNADVVVDPTLIGGFVAEGNSQRVDMSYKQQLVDLYRRITT